jgi:uncharacterized membrane protein
MPFCASCGTQVDGKFCPKCGAAIVAGGAAPPPSSAPYTAPPPGSAPYAAPVSAPMADNVAATLCYVLGLITGIIFLVLEPYSKNRAIRFHAFQSIFLNVLIIAIDIVFGIVFRILLEIVGVFALLAGIFWPIFGLGCFALWLYLLFSTYQGKTIVLPLIGPLAQKQAQS